MNHLNVSLDNKKLTSISPYIIIKSVEEQSPNVNIAVTSVASGIGQRVTQIERRFMDVVVKFAINLMKGHESQRTQILNDVNKWGAEGKTLRVSNRPNVHLSVMMVTQLAPGYVRKWNEEYSITFRAYTVPFWENDEVTSVTLKNQSSASASLSLSSNAKTPLRVYVKNTSQSSLTSIEFSCNGKKIKIDGLSVASGGNVDVDYENGLITIETNGKSAYSKRTADSSDDVWLFPGGNTVSFKSNVAAEWQVYCYERWL